MTNSELLKKDLFGEVRLAGIGADRKIVRDAGAAHAGLRWLARRLLRREARALGALSNIAGVPEVIELRPDRLTRSYLDGMPMHHGQPRDPGYFRAAARLLRQIHRANVVHNDLAKEPNLLLLEDGSPAFIDFQLAWHDSRRGRLFRLLAHDDLRHLLKHKRTYCEQHLSARERMVLANPSLLSRAWMATVKPTYIFVTRRLLGWADREGAGDRNAKAR